MRVSVGRRDIRHAVPRGTRGDFRLLSYTVSRGVCLKKGVFYIENVVRSEHGVESRIFEGKPIFGFFHRIRMRVYS